MLGTLRFQVPLRIQYQEDVNHTPTRLFTTQNPCFMAGQKSEESLDRPPAKKGHGPCPICPGTSEAPYSRFLLVTAKDGVWGPVWGVLSKGLRLWGAGQQSGSQVLPYGVLYETRVTSF